MSFPKSMYYANFQVSYYIYISRIIQKNLSLEYHQNYIINTAMPHFLSHAICFLSHADSISLPIYEPWYSVHFMHKVVFCRYTILFLSSGYWHYTLYIIYYMYIIHLFIYLSWSESIFFCKVLENSVSETLISFVCIVLIFNCLYIYNFHIFVWFSYK